MQVGEFVDGVCVDGGICVPGRGEVGADFVAETDLGSWVLAEEIDGPG